MRLYSISLSNKECHGVGRPLIRKVLQDTLRRLTSELHILSIFLLMSAIFSHIFTRIYYDVVKYWWSHKMSDYLKMTGRFLLTILKLLPPLKLTNFRHYNHDSMLSTGNHHTVEHFLSIISEEIFLIFRQTNFVLLPN